MRLLVWVCVSMKTRPLNAMIETMTILIQTRITVIYLSVDYTDWLMNYLSILILYILLSILRNIIFLLDWSWDRVNEAYIRWLTGDYDHGDEDYYHNCYHNKMENVWMGVSNTSDENTLNEVRSKILEFLHGDKSREWTCEQQTHLTENQTEGVKNSNHATWMKSMQYPIRRWKRHGWKCRLEGNAFTDSQQSQRNEVFWRSKFIKGIPGTRINNETKRNDERTLENMP